MFYCLSYCRSGIFAFQGVQRVYTSIWPAQNLRCECDGAQSSRIRITTANTIDLTFYGGAWAGAADPCTQLGAAAWFGVLTTPLLASSLATLIYFIHNAVVHHNTQL